MSDREKMKRLIIELLDMPDDKCLEESIVSKINTISPDPEWSNYIFQTDNYLRDDGTVDVDAVVEMAFSYKPIVL
ncbi:hypothetical protein GOB46_32005 [Sinorhizobium meliloti]|uniref:hypothetical protein n=1 Tax=Rhizobium meliloti TaxID=382 RepID=UPI00299DFE80|nr:hypothetical protein [Sinorhizobium meliloti]MDW9875606.1 hypothetical protein [Sinorhizobium meliloti]MDW9887821.1 hypothetical protein [Sinorhizobium meliloti]MDX0210068.1 hypothetical protein [Sinorhizobium meliloti]